MKTFKQYSNTALFSALFMMTFFMGGCGGSSSCEDIDRPTIAVGAPIITSTIPADGATSVPLATEISATFSEEINPNTVVDGQTFTVVDANGEPIPGTVSYGNNNTVMIFTPEIALDYNTTYTATITTDVTDMDGNALDITNGLNVWSFTTINDPAIIPPIGTTVAVGPDPVNLGTAGNFAILTKAGITDVPNSAITGNIGTSPITAAAIEVTCAEMTIGSIYGVDAAYVGSGDVTCYKGTSTDKTLVDNAVLDMVTAYNDAAGRTPAVGANLNIGAGSLDSTTPDFAPGLYTWGTDVTITDSITLTGNADDTWIFQISGNLILASGAPGAQIILGPNVQAKNVVWQVAGTNVTIGTGAQFSGVVLAKELIAVQTGASVEGRLLAQTEVTLDQNVITQPTP